VFLNVFVGMVGHLSLLRRFISTGTLVLEGLSTPTLGLMGHRASRDMTAQLLRTKLVRRAACFAIGSTACRVAPPATPPASASASCNAPTWSSPVTASVRGSRFPGRDMAIGFQGSHWLVAADSLNLADQPMQRAKFTIKGDGGLDWSPPGNTTAAFPHLAQSSPGAADVLWGGMAPEKDLAPWRWPPAVTTIWRAELRGDGTSTNPVALYSADMIDWNQVQPARPMLGPRGEMIALFSAASRFGRVIVVVRHRTSGWDVRELSLPVSAAYVTVAVLGDTVVAGIIGTADRSTHTNSVWVISSPDFGSTWSTPALIISPPHDAHYLSAAVFRGQAHLFWTQWEADGYGKSSLRHAVYNAATGQPGPIETLQLPHGAANVRTAVTSCAIHVIAGDYWPGAPEKGLLYTTWTDRWGPAAHILSDFLIDDADIASNERHDLAIAFSGFRFAGRDDAPPDLLISRAVRPK
jgi:hypothetical protein